MNKKHFNNRAVAIVAGLFAVCAGQADSVVTNLLPCAAWNILSNGVTYLVSTNMTLPRPEAGYSCLNLVRKSTVTIVIPEGVTLSVHGGDGSERIGGGAGVFIETGSTLILRGGGTLSARGGSGGSGGRGTSGDYATALSNGAGGRGGDGGGAPGCGIGAYGEYGGLGGARGNGGSGSKGENGSSIGMGILIVLDTVTIDAQAGRIGPVGEGGNGGDTSSGLNDTNGGGAGGGGGCGARSANIGGSGSSGGGGGGGGSGQGYAWGGGGGGGGGGAGYGGGGQGGFNNSPDGSPAGAVTGGPGGKDDGYNGEDGGSLSPGGSGGYVWSESPNFLVASFDFGGGDTSSGIGAAPQVARKIALSRPRAQIPGDDFVLVLQPDQASGTIANPPRLPGYQFDGYFSQVNGEGMKLFDTTGAAVSGSSWISAGSPHVLHAGWSLATNGVVITNCLVSSDLVIPQTATVQLEEDANLMDIRYQWFEVLSDNERVECSGAGSPTYTFDVRGRTPGTYRFTCRVTAKRLDNELMVVSWLPAPVSFIIANE